MRKLKIGGATVNQTPLDWVGNIDRIKSAIREAKEKNFDVICFPELAISAYGCQDLFLGPWISEKSVDLLTELIPLCRDMFVAIGLPVSFKGKVYNCVAAIADGKLAGITAKQNLAIDGVHYETRWFKAWKQGEIEKFAQNKIQTEIGDITYDYKGIKIGFEICEDAWIGENRPGTSLCKRGVELIMNPSASHFALGKTFDRVRLLKESSRDLNCAYVYSNLTGNEAGRMIYEGEILVADKGKIISKRENLTLTDFDVHGIELDFDSKSESDGSFESYQESYSKEEEFTKALTIGLFDYLRKSRSNGFVLSLSGGADSSTCAVLISEMVRRGLRTYGIEGFLTKINKQNLANKIDTTLPLEKTGQQIVRNIFFTAYQGTKNSSEDTLQSAKELADEIGANFYHWSIDSEVESYTRKIQDALSRELSWEKDDISLQNIQARARSPIIWMLANIKNSLLITTSNRSEGDVGYTTMDGDTSGSIAPIAAIDKPFIRNWLKYAENQYGYKSLKYVNSLSPTAELRPLGDEQSDEDDLMPYDIMLEIEKEAIEQHKDPVSVYLSLQQRTDRSNNDLKLYINKFFRLWCQNQWKRERIAPSFHLDSFNVDPKTWCRFPIISHGFSEELKLLKDL